MTKFIVKMSVKAVTNIRHYEKFERATQNVVLINLKTCNAAGEQNQCKFH